LTFKIAIGLLAFLALIVIMNGVKADTHIWDGGGTDALASTGDNWVSNVAPGSGDNCIWDPTGAGKPCTWDIATDPYQIYLDAGYNSQVTFTATCVATHGVTVKTGSSIVINSPKVLQCVMQSSSAYVNAGSIGGTGSFEFTLQGIDYTPTWGTITCPMFIDANSAAAANRICTFGSSLSLTTALTVQSNHATRTLTVDMAGYALTFSSISIGKAGSYGAATISSTVAGSKITSTSSITVIANGAIDATNIAYVVCVTNWDTSAGTWTPGTNQVNMTGTGTTKLAAIQSFYNLVVSSSITRTLQSDITITAMKDMAGTLTQGAYTVTISGTSTNPARLNGTWSGIINITSSGASYTIYTGPTWTGTLQFSKPLTLIYTGHHLTITPASAKYANVTLKTGGYWCGSTTSSLSLSFIWTGWTASKYYSVHADAVRVGGYSTDVAGTLNFSYNSWSAHNMTIDNYPTITSTPITTAIIGHQYSYDSNASEAGTWSLSSSYADLDIDANGVVSGFLSTNALSPAGDSISINITFTDSAGGVAYDTYTITIGGVQEDLIPMAAGVMIAVIVIGFTGVAINSYRRKMG
jgi:hypothetical protein